ncbi:MAG: GreA/GreB family elongation factor [Candidatus Dojkabacteria bacterium]|nr:MAG: GreA/GreB family elongation factor [Candidatus Dojkabacteria bacterium]
MKGLYVGRKKYFLTKQKVKELKKELSILETKGRQEIADSLNWLRDLPNSQEDDEFSDVLDNKRYLEKRIVEIKDILSNFEIVKHSLKDTVSVGTTVKVGFEGYVEKFMIVSALEADPLNNKISDESPVGRSLVGAKVGDKVLVDMGGIKKAFRILGIE